jgi:hypothetical protein
MKTLLVLKNLLFVFLFSVIGCTDEITDTTFNVGKESTFTMGQLYSTGDGLYTLQIKEITDSRCPQGVECIWAGEVVLKGEWSAGNNKSTIELHTIMKESQQQPNGYTLQIVDAKPYPIYGTPSKPEDLVITLLIQKN